MAHRFEPAGVAPGFTLIELLVVVAIIAILAAIAIPSFLGMRIRAYNSSTKAELHYGRIAQERHHVDHQAYANNLSTLKSVEVTLAQTRGVTFGSVAGDASNYTIVAYHQGGNQTYTATVTGIR